MCSDDDKCVERWALSKTVQLIEQIVKKDSIVNRYPFMTETFKVNAVSLVQKSELCVTSFAGADFTVVLLKEMLPNNLAI